MQQFQRVPIPGWEGLYSITRTGRIWSHRRWIESTDGRRWVQPGGWLKAALHPKLGYLYVGLHRDGVQETHAVHRLVASAFLPAPTAEQTHVNHKDSVRTHNHFANLEWCTHGENIAHAWSAGAMKVTPSMAASFKRVQKARRILSDTEAAEIRRRVAAGESQASLAREKNASRSLINMIVKNHRYQPTGGIHAV